MSWQSEAACRGLRGVMVDPPQDGRGHQDWTQARRICAACTVRAECLRAALDRDEPVGMWGGLDPEERAELRTQRRAS